MRIGEALRVGNFSDPHPETTEVIFGETKLGHSFVNGINIKKLVCMENYTI